VNDGKAFIINSAPGVGKSTLLKNLHLMLPDGFAVIDGDDFGRVIPYQNNIRWLNVIQDNIADCCQNFKEYGFNNCVIGFVFPVQERLNRIRDLLNKHDFDVIHIILTCDDDIIRKRIVRRNTSRLINAEQAAEINRQIDLLDCEIRIDTSYIDADEVSALVKNFMEKVIMNENH